jgi:GAF domain-containing protein
LPPTWKICTNRFSLAPPRLLASRAVSAPRWRLRVALIVRNETLGVIFSNHRERTVPFRLEVVDFAAELGAIISGALENARLCETQRHIATSLQQNFLHPLPSVAGGEFGLASEPARAAELVGGDFHDVFPVSAHELTILLGDVEGKGVVAAGLTETVHAAARALVIPARVC